ncbi:MAG: phytoene desaturase [Alphaproteobacteria bacterium]|nr:phytoene desaturase [Alphaproteobacteria bacterium]
MADRARIVGAGIAGLGAALRLRAAGWDVEVLERQPILGGKIHCVEHDGYRFDAGPSFLTQPERLDELFALFGERLADHLALEEVDPSVRYWWPDGTTISTPRDREALVAELAKLGATPARIHAYLDELARQYDAIGAPFVDDHVTRPGFWIHPRTITNLPTSMGMLGKTFAAYNQSWFPDAPKLVQFLGRYATYAGNDPFRAPAFMASIADVELRQGIWYPEDGLRSVPEALVALGQRHGVRFRTSAGVEGFERDGRRVTGLRLGDGVEPADLVVCALDPQHVAGWLERPLSPVPRATSALIWFMGVDAVPGIGLHNLFFSSDYASEFAHIADGAIVEDPTIYVNCSSVMSPSHAPPGKQNWFVMVNAPADAGQDWAGMADSLRPHVVGKLERLLGQRIVVHSESTYAPPDIARTSGAWAGAIYGPAANRLIDLFRKQPARDAELENLFYCGGSSHPGGGIPMCLSSARLAVQTIEAAGLR